MLKMKYCNQVKDFRLKEPIIVSGQYCEIKLLSVYDFMLCMCMYKKLKDNEIFEGLEEEIIENICEEASIVARSLHNSEGKRIFHDAEEVIKTLTPYELKNIYNEYKLLSNKISKRNTTIKNILDKARKFANNK